MNARSLMSALAALAAMTLLAMTNYAQPPDTAWTQVLGGSGYEQCYSLQQTADGGYILAGWTDSYGAGREDLYLEKIDARGNLQWRRTYGGEAADYGESVQQTADGGYILAGWTDSFGAGSYDMYVVKTDSEGSLEWQRTFGGDCDDYGYSVQQTSDGGYVLAGATRATFADACDVYLVKADAQGNLEWQKTFAGVESDVCYSVQQTADGGYILGGDSDSFGSGAYNHDMYLVKTDARGNLQWQKTFGGQASDGCYCVAQTADGGYILAGDSESFGESPFDVYLVKTDAKGRLSWQRTFGGEGWDDCYAIQPTADGGYILGGFSDSYGSGDFDMYLIKTDKLGYLQWQKTLGGSDNDYAYCLQQTTGGGYVLGGYSESRGDRSDDMRLVCLEEMPGEGPDASVSLLWPAMSTWSIWHQNLPAAVMIR